jgi:UDP:flavonoid glycosyltransferase YjiC (YdhE family)
MRVLFHFEPAPGHVEASLPLARVLAARGHDIVYSAAIDQQAAIEARGFRWVAVHRGIWRPGPPLDPVERDARIADEYLRGTIDAHVRAIAPDAVIADARGGSPIQLVAFALGIPCLQLSTTLSQHLGAAPPLTSSLAPDASPLELAAARWLASCLRASGVAMGVSARTERYAARFDYPQHAISLDTVLGPAFLTIPEVVAGAAALELPAARGGPPHAAISVDLDAPSEPIAPALAAFVEGQAALTVAPVNDRDARSPHGRRLVDALVGAARLRPDRRVVILTGDPPTDLPRNALAVAAAPRPWLLRRAAALVTTADLLEIREAIALHVPIVAVPLAEDQHGNAARVVYHGIGVAIAEEGVIAANLATAIDRVSSPACLARLRALDASCRREEAEHRGVALVEQLVAARGAPDRRPPLERDATGRPAASGSEPAGARPGGWLFLELAEAELDPAVLPAACSIGDALGGATGTRLVRCQWGGAKLRGIDATDLLQEYALWCAEAALEPAASGSPERAAMFRELIAEYRAARAAGASAVRLERLHRRALGYAARLWHHGYGAVPLAMASDRPERNAKLARFEALGSLARALAARGAEPFRRTYLALTERFDAELSRRILDAARRAGMEIDG